MYGTTLQVRQRRAGAIHWKQFRLAELPSSLSLSPSFSVMKNVSPKQIRWVLILVAVLVLANLQFVLEPVVFVSINAIRKLRG